MHRSLPPAASAARRSAALRLVPPAFFLLLLILLSALVRAQSLPEVREAAIRPGDAGTGRLLFKRDDGGFVPAPLVSTDIPSSGPTNGRAISPRTTIR